MLASNLGGRGVEASRQHALLHAVLASNLGGHGADLVVYSVDLVVYAADLVVHVAGLVVYAGDPAVYAGDPVVYARELVVLAADVDLDAVYFVLLAAACRGRPAHAIVRSALDQIAQQGKVAA